MTAATGQAYPKGGADETPPVHIVQITDTHLFADANGRLHDVETLPALTRAVAAIAAGERPDLVLATGDLTQDASAVGYRRFVETLQPLDAPVLALPGNHDDAAAMATAFAGSRVRLNTVEDIGNWRIVSIDSTLQGETFGRLSPSELERLDTALDGAQHAMVCLHHPPLAVGSSWLDAIALDNTREFFAVTERHANVRIVLAGHVHQDRCVQRGTTTCFTTPSTAIQYLPASPRPVLDPTPPGYRRLRLYADGRFETEVMRLAQQVTGNG